MALLPQTVPSFDILIIVIKEYFYNATTLHFVYSYHHRLLASKQTVSHRMTIKTYQTFITLELF